MYATLETDSTRTAKHADPTHATPTTEVANKPALLTEKDTYALASLDTPSSTELASISTNAQPTTVDAHTTARTLLVHTPASAHKTLPLISISTPVDVLASNASELKLTKSATLKDTESAHQMQMHVKTKSVFTVERNTSSNNANKRRLATTTSSKTQEKHGFQASATEVLKTTSADAVVMDICVTTPNDHAPVHLPVTLPRWMLPSFWTPPAPSNSTTSRSSNLSSSLFSPPSNWDKDKYTLL